MTMTYKRILTLIGEGQAKVGHVFKLYSIPEECKRCRLYNICIARLKVGRKYRVVEVRRVNLPRPDKCLLTGENLVPVVVEELPVVVALPYQSNLIEGVVVTYTVVDSQCQDRLCTKYGEEKCTVQPGVKLKILNILGSETCNGRKYLIVRCVPLD